MEKRQQILVALLAILASVVSGCAMGTPFGIQSVGTNSSLGQVDQSKENFPAMGQAFQGKKSFGNSVSSAFKTAGSKVSNAFKIQPKVIKADDPISLSGKPEKINADLYISMALIFESQNKTAEASSQYEKALQVAPDNLQALIGFARLNDRAGNFDRAIQLYQKATTKHSDSAVAFNDLGLCHARKGNLDQSLQALFQAVKLHPERKLYRNNLATVLIESGEIDQAYSHLAQAHGEASAHYNIGFFLQRRNDRQRAIEHFTLALEKNPSLTAAQVMIDRLQVPEPETYDIASIQNSDSWQNNISSDNELNHQQQQSLKETNLVSDEVTLLPKETPLPEEYRSIVAEKPAPLESEVAVKDYPALPPSPEDSAPQEMAREDAAAGNDEQESNDSAFTLPGDTAPAEATPPDTDSNIPSSERDSQFPTLLPAAETTEEPSIEFPAIRLPDVGSNNTLDENGPMPPTPNQFVALPNGK